MSLYRKVLPQQRQSVFLTDSGLETDLIFNHGLELPDFASFVLLDNETGRAALRRYFQTHVDEHASTAWESCSRPPRGALTLTGRDGLGTTLLRLLISTVGLSNS